MIDFRFRSYVLLKSPLKIMILLTSDMSDWHRMALPHGAPPPWFHLRQPPLFIGPSPTGLQVAPIWGLLPLLFLLSRIFFPRYGQSSLQLCAQRAVPCPPPPALSIHLLLIFPPRLMTIWHSVYFTHLGFYLWSFPTQLQLHEVDFGCFCSLLYFSCPE